MSDDYNQRQYWLILERIKAYQANTLGLHALSGSIRGLISALEGVPDSLRDALVSEWGVLHDINAGMIDSNNNILSDECAWRITKAVTQLKDLVLRQIDDPAEAKRD